MNIKNIIRKSGKKKDPRIDNDLNDSLLDEIVEESALKYRNMYITSSIFIQLMYMAKTGIFIVLPIDPEDDQEELAAYYGSKVQTIQDFLGVTPNTAFVFLFSDDKAFLVQKNRKSLIELDDFYKAFGNLYTNMLRPCVDQHFLRFMSLESMLQAPELPEEYKEKETYNGCTYTYHGKTYVIEDDYKTVDTGTPSYVRNLVSDKLIQQIDTLVYDLQDNDPPNAAKRTDPDGNEYIMKHSDVLIAGNEYLNTGLAGKQSWFRLSDYDPNKIAAFTAFGGWFGLHKFYIGSLWQGLFYLLTCGCMGVLPAIDLIQQITGNASFYQVHYSEIDGINRYDRKKEKCYLRRPTKKLLCIGGVIVCLTVSIIASQTLYRQGFYLIADLVGSSANHMSPQTAENVIQILKHIIL